MPAQRLAQFGADISRARDLVGLGQALGEMTHGRVDGSDLYRAALVQAVAALDSYVHGVVLDRAVDMILGRLSITGSEAKVGLHFSAIQSVTTAGSEAEAEINARTHIAQRLSRETFQGAEAVGQALAMVGVGKIWSTAFGDQAEPTKTALGVVVGRRNRIAHACDIDTLNTGEVTMLNDNDALAALTTIESIVTAIDQYC